MKRLFDFLIAGTGLIVLAPLLLTAMFLIWSKDRHSPLYIAPRVGLGERNFKMIKLRSMVVNADKDGIDSTSSDDKRITTIGIFIRRYKLDELVQLWNVMIGDMSLVGPRPNVKRETDLYTDEEKKLLTVRPGITDFSSIIFSDEGEILFGKEDPDLAYNQLIRPYKSHLGLFYIEKRSFFLDLRLCILTLVAVFSRETALHEVSKVLKNYGAETELAEFALRKKPLLPTPPPGAQKIVTTRNMGK